MPIKKTACVIATNSIISDLNVCRSEETEPYTGNLKLLLGGLELLFDALASFGRELVSRFGLVMIRALMGRFAQESELLPISPAPSAKKKMDLQPKPFEK